MPNDPISVLNDILKRSGEEDVDVGTSEVDRYFLFDRIEDPADLDLAWSQFPAHEQIRARAEEIDAVSDIMPGWGYRVPRKSNRCSDAELIDAVRRHITAMEPFLLREDYNQDVLEFLSQPYDVQVVSQAESAEPEDNSLLGTVYEAIGEFKLNHYSFQPPIKEILYDWCIYLTKCDEVALYVLWPALDDVCSLDPNMPSAGFELWRVGCRESYWMQDNDPKSGIVCVQPPWGATEK